MSSEHLATQLAAQLAAPLDRVPRATYRVQFHRGFTFQDAEAIVPYLASLGVSHLYASPIFKANPGSMHGYDIVDFGQLNPELGTQAEFDHLSAALKRQGLGLMLDFVPNHMSIASGRNAWWQDVLEHGPDSQFAAFFDIDWEPIKPELENQVLLPVLGDHYGVVLENQELELRFEDGAFALRYDDLPLPIAPRTYPMILADALAEIESELEPSALALLELQSIVAAFARLREPGLERADRLREQFLTKRRLAQLAADAPIVAGAIGRIVRAINGSPTDPASFDALDRLISRQFYRLSFWRVAAEEINYRRFFAINDLAAIRQEEPAVFDAAHALLLRLIAEGKVEGVRIDHPDGLWDPAAYFRNLRSATEAINRSVYLVVEKILERGEELPADWAVDGTVGYEFAQSAGGLLVDGKNRKPFDDLYGRFTGGAPRFDDLVYDKKKLIMRVALASEVNVLARALDRLSEFHRRTRDFTFNSLRDAMSEVIACFPIYRTYATCEPEFVTERDRAEIERAVTEAIRRNPASERGVFDFVREILLLNEGGHLSAESRAGQCRFVAKFQQLSGPVMAKGLEDTAFYAYFRLSSLNEVGGDPAQFGVDVREFHRRNVSRQERWPHAMLSSSTHDTKRSEDVRARISALSEMPRPWRFALNRWARFNRRFKTKVDGALAPDRNDECLFYQTLLGAWPLGLDRPGSAFVDRMDAYFLKAIREAQVHSSWINPNQGYDDAARSFVRAVLAPENAQFLTDFGQFQARIATVGAFNSLTQHLLKLTAPGVPDIYQGTETWDFSLVDPDNRRPVDFAWRSQQLAEMQAQPTSPEFARSLVETWADGRIKLFVTQRTLAFRQQRPDLFTQGSYLPIGATGPKADHLVAFARQYGDEEAVVVTPRLIDGLLIGQHSSPTGDCWRGTRLSLPRTLGGGRYRCLFTGADLETGETGELEAAAVLADFPVAVLINTGQ